MVHEDGARLIVGAQILHHVEVRRDNHQVEHRLRINALDLIMERGARLAQALHDSLALAADALAVKVLGLGLRMSCDLRALGLGLGLFNRANLDGFALVLCRDAQPLLFVDLIHRVLDLSVGVDVRDGRAEDLVAEVLHRLPEVLEDVGRHLLLGCEHCGAAASTRHDSLSTTGGIEGRGRVGAFHPRGGVVRRRRGKRE